MLAKSEKIAVDLIVFDLDGTLADTLPDLFAAANFACRRLGLPEQPEAAIRTMVGGGERKLIERLVGPDHQDQVDACLELYLEHYTRHNGNLTRVYPGVVETLERLGRILLERTVISKEELRKAAEQQILQIIYRVFRWQDGDYHFSQETSIDYDAEYVTPISAESILMEGARMLDEWPMIERKLPGQDGPLVRGPSARRGQHCAVGHVYRAACERGRDNSERRRCGKRIG